MRRYLTTLMLQSGNWQLFRIVLSIWQLFVLFTVKILLAQKLNLIVNIIFYNFQPLLTQQQCIKEPNSIFANKAPSRSSVYGWVVRRIDLTWHRLTSFYYRSQKITWEINVFRNLKKRLMLSECMFWRCLNQSVKVLQQLVQPKQKCTDLNR